MRLRSVGEVDFTPEMASRIQTFRDPERQRRARSNARSVLDARKADVTVASDSLVRRDQRTALLGVGSLLRALAHMGQQLALAQADVQRRHFHQLIVLDIGHRLLERHRHDGRQAHRFIL